MSVLAVDVSHDLGRFRLRARFHTAGGLTVLFGPSGAGKSLTLSVIAGLLRPDRASVRLDDRILDDTSAAIHVPTRERRVGIVFQEGLLLPHRSALDNVALAIRRGSRTRRRSAAADWLARVGAEELARRRPRTLSGGQRQRVALARALAAEPQLLLLDEPLSALDLPTRRSLRTLVRELVRERGVPTLFVTHDEDEVRALADAVVIYEAGAVVRVTHGDGHRPTATSAEGAASGASPRLEDVTTALALARRRVSELERERHRMEAEALADATAGDRVSPRVRGD